MDIKFIDETVKRTLINFCVLMFAGIFVIYTTNEYYLKYDWAGSNGWMPYGAFSIVISCIIYQIIPFFKRNKGDKE